MSPRLLRILVAALAGAAGSVAASGEAPDLAPALNAVVTFIGVLAPLLLRTKAGK